MLTRLHAVVHGRVQGVAFRATTAREARRLGLAGWVRNLPDGSVEVTAEGAPDRLEQLEAFLWVGPRVARVDSVVAERLPASGDLGPFGIED